MLVFVAAVVLTATTVIAAMGGRPASPVVVYVTSQGLYYDSIVGPALPQKGPFQQLFPPGTNPDLPDDFEYLSTEFGPGTPGHKGGRWWVDANGDGAMDDGDSFFSCPLLGPGRSNP